MVIDGNSVLYTLYKHHFSQALKGVNLVPEYAIVVPDGKHSNPLKKDTL